MNLEKEIVYGPLRSRRFGWDLGINLLPTDRKLCTFDCVYCQYGLTPPILNTQFHFPSANQVIQALVKKIQITNALRLPLQHVTLCGNGEPTMHPHFPEICRELKAWRDREAPSVRLAVLSNGYRLHDSKIRESVELFDEPVIKLDSVIPKKLRHINRPLAPFDPVRLISTLQCCKKIRIQTMFVKGWNDGIEDIREWQSVLQKICPVQVQIYTIDRTPPFAFLEPVSQKHLAEIARETSRILNLPVDAF